MTIEVDTEGARFYRMQQYVTDLIKEFQKMSTIAHSDETRYKVNVVHNKAIKIKTDLRKLENEWLGK